MSQRSVVRSAGSDPPLRVYFLAVLFFFGCFLFAVSVSPAQRLLRFSSGPLINDLAKLGTLLQLINEKPELYYCSSSAKCAPATGRVNTCYCFSGEHRGEYVSSPPPPYLLHIFCIPFKTRILVHFNPEISKCLE